MFDFVDTFIRHHQEEIRANEEEIILLGHTPLHQVGHF